MALNTYNIRKWYRMLTGKSVLHVHQDMGKAFATDKLRGYFNNLTEKVTFLPQLLNTDELPQYKMPSGKLVTFPVAIFQYGLGAYDLYLLTGDATYKNKFIQCCQWAVQHQEPSGAWNTFFFKYPHYPYGAMSQGEGASLLLRGYQETHNENWLAAAKRAIDFMLLPLSEGGCTQYHDDGGVVLCEYTHLPIVMNGWVFAWFGLHDYVLATHDNERYIKLLEQSEKSLEATLPSFSCRYWSLYDLSGKMASPFYHRLHIAQMQALYLVTNKTVYKTFAEKWERDLHNPLFKSIAFIRKAWQKIREKEAWTN
ncbi:MAG: D-glucuronyl C5-epimerase family protein [Prevotella sp.]|jgi:heparosan-N-sulfate-glucuronate 5-epimerase